MIVCNVHTMRTCSMRFLKQALFLRLEKIQFLHFKYKNVLEFLLPCEHESAQNHIRGWLQALALTNEHQGSASGIRSCELLQTILRRKAGRFAKGSTLRWSGSYRRIPIGGAGWGRWGAKVPRCQGPKRTAIRAFREAAPPARRPHRPTRDSELG